MAKSIKKISIAALDKVAKEHFPNVVTESWFDNEVVIKPFRPKHHSPSGDICSRNRGSSCEHYCCP